VLDAPEPWQNLSPPGLSRDLVVIAPNCGAVMAVGRFDGKLRWLRSYDQAQSQPQRGATSGTRDALLRWSTTPQVVADSYVLVAPLDAPRLVSLDARSGRKLWHTDDLGAATVVGAARGNVIVADASSVTALDAAGGDVRWTASPGPGGVCGPVTTDAAGQFVFVPTRDGSVVTLSADKGKVVASPPPAMTPPDLRAVLRAETGSTALRAAGALDAFTVRTAEPDDGNTLEKPSRSSRPPRSRSGGRDNPDGRGP
jgi:outer membrane protein assembly factor BamB